MENTGGSQKKTTLIHILFGYKPIIQTNKAVSIKQFNEPVEYNLIADRFLEKDEIELSTGTIFLKKTRVKY